MTAPEVKVETKVEVPVKDQNKPIENNPQATIQTEEAPKNAKDWDKFREARAQDRKRAQEQTEKAQRAQQEAEALKAALDAVLNKPQQQQQQYQSYEQTEETEEQKIEKKVSEVLARREKQYVEERQRREQQEYPEKLVSNFSDFNQVCNTENLDYLEYHYPEVASAFKHAPDGYDKWANIYKAVKRFVPNTDAKKDIAKAEANSKKPQSVSSPGMASAGEQGQQAYRLTEQKRRENWERMQRTMNKLE